MSEAPLLELKELKVAYGGIQAVRSLDLEVPAGSICGFLGKNGSGKSCPIWWTAIRPVFRPYGGVNALDRFQPGRSD